MTCRLPRASHRPQDSAGCWSRSWAEGKREISRFAGSPRRLPSNALLENWKDVTSMVRVGSAGTIPVGTMLTVGASVAVGGTSVAVVVGGTGAAVGATAGAAQATSSAAISRTLNAASRCFRAFMICLLGSLTNHLAPARLLLWPGRCDQFTPMICAGASTSMNPWRSPASGSCRRTPSRLIPLSGSGLNPLPCDLPAACPSHRLPYQRRSMRPSPGRCPRR